VENRNPPDPDNPPDPFAPFALLGPVDPGDELGNFLQEAAEGTERGEDV